MKQVRTLEEFGTPLRELREQFELIVETVRPSLWRYCLRLTGSPWDAEDLVQETMARAFARLTLFWQPLDPRPYLFRIATNAWIDSLRRARLPVESQDNIPDAPGVSDPSDTLAAMEILVTVLPPRQRVIFLLIEVFDFTGPEVAAMIGSSEGAVKAALHRARATLKQQTAHGGTPVTERQVPPPNAVVSRFLEAFNRRDAEALVALLADHVTVDILNAGEEQGAEYARKYSLADWAADPQQMWAECGRLAGRDVVWVYFRTADHPRSLAWIVTLEVAGDRITTMRNFCFCPDLLRYAGDLLGEPTALYGYRYQSPAQ